MALRVHFERPATGAAVDHEFRRLQLRFTTRGTSTHELRRYARSRLEAIGRLKFHVASWVLGMVVLTPIWVLIEWQDNGGFQRWSDNGNPGDWEPTMLYVGVVWALAIGVLRTSSVLRSADDRGRNRTRGRAAQVANSLIGCVGPHTCCPGPRPPAGAAALGRLLRSSPHERRTTR